MRKINKKGSILDLIMVGIILLFFSMCLLVGYKITHEVVSALNANADVAASPEAVASNNKLEGYYSTVMDGSFLFLTIALCIVVLVLASLVRVHPIFIVPGILLWIFAIFLSGVFADVYWAIASDPAFIAQANSMIFTTYIMKYLPLITGVLGMVLAAVMYKLWSNE